MQSQTGYFHCKLTSDIPEADIIAFHDRRSLRFTNNHQVVTLSMTHNVSVSFPLNKYDYLGSFSPSILII